MRISDWSSDVCSSDLLEVVDAGKVDERHLVGQQGLAAAFVGLVERGRAARRAGEEAGEELAEQHAPCLVRRVAADHLAALADQCHGGREGVIGDAELGQRSEEHTSELQTLMRISYAVFC